MTHFGNLSRNRLFDPAASEGSPIGDATGAKSARIQPLRKPRTDRLHVLETAGISAYERYRLRRLIDLAEFDAIWDKMKKVSPSVMAHALWELGCLRDTQEVITAESIAARCGSMPKYRSLMSQWLPELVAAGFVQRVPGTREAYAGKLVDVGHVRNRIDAALSSVDVSTPYPGFIEYFKTCLKHQTDLLAGRSNPQKLLFPAGSSRIVDGLYRDNPASAMQNQVVAAVVQAAAREWLRARPLRVLEVGAGTGATTAAILADLPSTRVEYRFTDVSRFFLKRAAREFASHPYVTYELLDIDRHPLEQGFATDSFDVIVAANVLHTAKHIDVTLGHLHSLLSGGGALVAIETTSNTALQMITFGHFEGVCHFQDQRQHSHLPFLSCTEWRSAFRDAGFTDVTAIPSDESGSKAWMQHVLLGSRGAA